MPRKKHHDTITLHGYEFRLRRILGFAASSAQWAWASVVGPRGAHVLALGTDKLATVAAEAISPEQRKAFEALGELDNHRALAMLGIVQCMDRGRMTPADLRYLVEHFVLGWVDIKAGGKWVEIDSTATLDEHLDGTHDAQVWTDLVWRQIPHCLGPTIGGDGTSDDTPPMEQT